MHTNFLSKLTQDIKLVENWKFNVFFGKNVEYGPGLRCHFRVIDGPSDCIAWLLVRSYRKPFVSTINYL